MIPNPNYRVNISPITPNPHIYPPILPIGKNEPEIEYLTSEEVADFLDKVSNDYWYPAFVTALGTGLRVGELAGLQWKNVDLQGGILKVEQTIVRIKTHGTETAKSKLIIQKPKTKKSIRRVPLPLDVIKTLKTLQAKQRNYKGNVIELRSDDFVFAWPDGRSKVHIKTF